MLKVCINNDSRTRKINKDDKILDQKRYSYDKLSMRSDCRSKGKIENTIFPVNQIASSTIGSKSRHARELMVQIQNGKCTHIEQDEYFIILMLSNESTICKQAFQHK